MIAADASLRYEGTQFGNGAKWAIFVKYKFFRYYLMILSD